MSRSKQLTDRSPMPFGEHEGTKMANVPADYLAFIFKQDWIDQWPYVHQYIEDNWNVIQMELE